MDEQTNTLKGPLKERMAGIFDGQIAEIIREARAEALAEAKVIIREIMVEAILTEALGEMGGTSNSVQHAMPAMQRSAESEEQIRQEIRAIRRKVAENERLLSQGRGSTPEPTRVQEPPVEQEASAPGEGTQEDYGYYVYGIVAGDSGQLAEKLPEEGIDPAYPVYALSYRAIWAIMSRVSLQEFGQERLEAHLNDPEWLKAKAYAHQGALEAVLTSHTLVPVRFCTIYRSESRVLDMLARNHDDLVDALARLKGKKEWGVKVYCDREVLAQRVGEVSDQVRNLSGEMANKADGAAYFLKKKLQEIIAEEVERLSDECAQRSHDLLSSQAEESTVNPLQSKEGTGREEGMILNGAYLVAEEQLATFQAQLDYLRKEYGDLGSRYDLTGPWPPYSFVTIALEEAVADEPAGG